MVSGKRTGNLKRSQKVPKGCSLVYSGGVGPPVSVNPACHLALVLLIDFFAKVIENLRKFTGWRK